jgi:hypothetical protein
LHLYPTEDGGRKQPAFLGWCCPCFLEKDGPRRGVESLENLPVGYDACPLIGDEPMYPGEHRRVGFVCLFQESVEALHRAGHFYLWDGRFVGEAHVVRD